MTNLIIIENKISSIKKYLKILEKYKKYQVKDIKNNVDLRGATERYLYLVTQATIDLAEAVVSYKKLRKPSTMSESFHILNEEEIISDELTEKMIGLTGFRNIIAYDYEKVNYDIVFNILRHGLVYIENFIKIISKL